MDSEGLGGFHPASGRLSLGFGGEVSPVFFSEEVLRKAKKGTG